MGKGKSINSVYTLGAAVIVLAIMVIAVVTLLSGGTLTSKVGPVEIAAISKPTPTPTPPLTPVTTLNNELRVARENKEWQKVVSLSEEILGRDKNHPEAKSSLVEGYYQRGTELRAKGDYVGALDDFKRALDRGYSPSSDIYRQLSLAYTALKNFQAANIAAGKALELAKTSTEKLHAYMAFGELHFDLGEYDQAFKAYNLALGFANNNPDALTGLGKVYWITSKFSSAVEVLEKAISLSPKHPYAFFYCGMAYRELGDVAKAKTYLKRASDNGNQKAQVELGKLPS